MANKLVKQRVVAFRLTAAQYEAFVKKIAEQPMVGANSPGMVARKMALDFTADALSWKSKKRRIMDSDVYSAHSAVAA